MKLWLTPVITAMWLLIVPAGRLRPQELPRATTQYGAFAFADPSGARLLVVSGASQPEDLRTALCSGGRRFSVQFDRRQAAQEGNNGRQWSGNFDKLAGDVYTVPQGKIDENESCFMASDALLSGATVVPAGTPPKRSECDADVRGRVAASRSRRVVNCRTIARLPADRSLILAEFAREDKNALASVVLIDRERMIFADYHAVYRGEGEDLWRIGDSGALDVDDFRVVFLVQRGSFYALGVAWAGEEGLNLSVFVSNGDDHFDKVIADYWYREPV